jgi:hypothetical protein
MANDDVFRDLAQLRLIDLPGAIPIGELSLPIQQKDVGFPDEDRSDESLLKEAIQNRSLSESFEASRGLIGSWNLTELMLRAYVEPIKWKNSDQFRSHLGIPILAEHFYSMIGVVQENLFGGYNPFILDPTSGTDIDTAAAETALIRAQMKHCGFRGVTFKQEMRHVVYDGLLYGTGVAFFGWEFYQQEIKKLRNKHQGVSVGVSGGSVTIPMANEDDTEEYTDHVLEFNQGKFEHVPIRRLRVDPSCRRGEIQTAGWAGRLIYPNSYDLDRWRETEGFNIPSRDELIALTTPWKVDGTGHNMLDTQGGSSPNPIFQTSTTPQKAMPESYDFAKSDPLSKNWEVFDYWTPYRHIMVLEGQYCIYNQPHNLGRIPFLSFVFREAPDSFYGYGLGFWLTDYQRISQGIVNAFFDDVNLNLMGTYTTDAGMNNTAQTQWIFPGKIMKSDPGKKIEPLTRNSIMEGPPLAIIEQVKSWAVAISGAGVNAQGVNAGKAGDMRTGAGVQALSTGENIKSTDLIDQISDGIFVPFIEYLIEQNHKLKPSQIKNWLSDELSTAYKKVDPLSVLNGQYKVTVSAATRLRARQQLNTVMGFVQTLITAPGAVELLGVQAMKLNVAEFYKAIIDSSGLPYRENILQPMTDEDKQRYAASQQQPDNTAKKIQMQTDGKMKIDNNQAENRMLLEAGKHGFGTAMNDQQHQHTLEEDAFNRSEREAMQKSDSQFEGGE